ncbi:MAG TPA: nucleoside recognition domain-containing protein [Vicinamibacteria bacterium]|nr:nucleoside recognition domain-containing protein [Vicinamibacteria bacterium]
MLNWIWAGFFFVAFLAGLFRWLVLGEPGVWAAMVGSSFEMAKTGFEISIGLTGVMCLWLGIMKIGEKGGAVSLVARAFDPLLRRLFPSIPPAHPAGASIVMNLSANMLGLDNAATPLGLKAMKELQEINPEPDTASNDQIMFLVVNASAVTLIPTAIMTYRAQMGAKDPTDVFLPLLIATFCSTMTGILVTARLQGLRLANPVTVAYFGSATLVIGLAAAYVSGLDKETLERQTSLFANLSIFSVIVGFVLLAVRKGVAVYETFVEGAKEGFTVAVGIIPHLVGMLVAIGILRTSGVLDQLLDAVRLAVASVGLDGRWVDALPVALVRPLSGSGARGLVIETMKTLGADSFAGRLACIIQGSTETTFYVLAVYFGSVGIKNTRHAIACGLTAEFAGFLGAIAVSYLFFG